MHAPLCQVSPMGVHGEIDGDAAHPKEDAAIVGFELVNAFHGSGVGLGENIFGQLRDG
jgi:hypothetical protein